MKKRFLMALTALCVAALSAFTFAACAPRPVNEETRVNGFSFREYGDGYEVVNYLGDKTEIKIPDTYKDKSVIGIGARAFSNTQITGITIPDSITTIGPSAFESCKELEEINIPESVTSIGDQAFSYCEGLTAVTMPKNLSYAGEFIFWYCTGLKEITIPDGVTALPYGIFARCNGLTEINIPNSVTDIGVYAFSGLDKITSVTIPHNVTSIGKEAFRDCKRLVEVYNLSALELTETSLFGDTMTSGILDIYTDENAPSKLSVENDFVVHTADDGTKTVIDYIGTDGKAVVPQGVTNIIPRAFEQYENIHEIEIPEGVTVIPYWTFIDCLYLTKVTLPESLVEIQYGAFNSCKNLSTVIIPGRVRSIESGAFCYCISLTTVTIPSSVVFMKSGIFAGCNNLKTIYCEAAEQPNGWYPTWLEKCSAQVVWNYNGVAEFNA